MQQPEKGDGDPRRAARAAVARWRSVSGSVDPDRPDGRRILIAASFTANQIGPSLGLAVNDQEPDRNPPRIEFADYNQIFQVCLQPDHFGATDDAADEVVILWRIEDVFERDFHAWSNRDTDAARRLVDGVRSLAQTVGALAQARRSPVIVSDATVPIGFGLDHRDPTALAELVDLQQLLNREFDASLASAGGTGVERVLLSSQQLAHGTLATFDSRNWVMYRQPYPDWFASVVGASIADVIAARTRVPPKVLVLDLDNTVWGGTLVDDGVGGLQASDAFPGFAYRSFQIAAHRLRHRGVLLAIASKNDPERVAEAFAEVDGMILTLDDFAARRVSWDPKPDAIAEIANELNLGLDSFVFVDDSDYELGAVITQLSGVRVLRVPDDIEDLPDLLAESGWFRGLRVTDDDLQRTERMQAEAGRARAATNMTHDEFLASLGLRVHVIDVGPEQIGRVTQLINKTNQFNLTTRRRSESEVTALVHGPDAEVLAFAADDRFGEYGIIGVTVAIRQQCEWDLDTVLMSCRVLGRGVETAILSATTDHLRAKWKAPIVGHYAATERNAMVAELLPQHGFTGTPDRFVLEPDERIPLPAHVTVVPAS